MTDTPTALPAAELLARAAARWPERTAVVADGKRIAFRALDRAASRLAAALADAQLGQGHTIAILSPNRIEYPIFHMGAARAGSLQAHLTIRYTADDLAHVINKIGIEAVFADAGMLANLRAARPRTPTLKTVVVIGEPAGPPAAGEIGWDAFQAGAGDAPPNVAIKPEDPFCITFTGGTTGFPKGVLATHGARSYIAQVVAEPFELTPRDIAVLATPMFHLAGLSSWFYSAMAAGTSVALMPRWDPAAFIAAVERERATMGFLVPTMINGVLNDPGFAPERLASLRLLNYGGAPMPVALLERVFERLPKLRMLDHYGQSEGGALAYRPPERARDKPTSNGIPFACVEMAFFDGAGHRLREGQIGELCVKGPQVCSGYYREPELTKALFTPDGWLKTGDVGYRDTEGFLFLVDRAKDMIIAGGENIYPAEIENALFQHPAVKECAVFGIPDAHWGEVPAAHVVLAEGQKVSPEALADFVAGKIARHKRPRLVKFVDALPKTAIGKVQKNLLRKPYWEGRARGI
ncbi:MAG TPA: AMP-binding protein [Alphaproteobacteria bacterium]|jgi:acyl-CoA synthetase (AMP-forming)/AMP-acid ligase II